MAGFESLVSELRRAEQQLEQQLQSVRGAIASLQTDGSVSPAVRQSGVGTSTIEVVRKRRRLSAAARQAISDAQKKRWAKQRAAAK